MSERQMLGYHPDSTWIHRKRHKQISLFNRCLCGLYDRMILVICWNVCGFAFLLKLSNIKWHQISFVIKFIAIFLC